MYLLIRRTPCGEYGVYSPHGQAKVGHLRNGSIFDFRHDHGLFPRKCGKIDLTVDLEPLRVALLVRIADSLDAIREGMAPAGPVLATVAGGYVKCPSCGDLNAQGADVCRACGKAMAA